MEIIEISKELNEGFKKIQDLCEDNIDTIKEGKSTYDKYVLDSYPILLDNYRKELEYSQELLKEVKEKNEKINSLEDKINKLTR